MANKEHIKLVIASIRGELDAINDLQVGFNMFDYISTSAVADAISYGRENSRSMDQGPNNCGTVACMAGHAYILARLEEGGDIDLNENAVVICNVAQQYLDVPANPVTISDLFYPRHRPLDQVTVDEAVATLEHLADTGEILWKEAA